MIPETRQAGRELDAEIAEKVMGWSSWCSPMVPRGSTVPDCWQTGNLRSPTIRISGFKPSSDIACAWLVVEKMRERGYEPCVEAQSNGQLPGWQCWFGHMLYDAGYAESDSVPLAICQSALSALASLLVSGERDA